MFGTGSFPLKQNVRPGQVFTGLESVHQAQTMVPNATFGVQGPGYVPPIFQNAKDPQSRAAGMGNGGESW